MSYNHAKYKREWRKKNPGRESAYKKAALERNPERVRRLARLRQVAYGKRHAKLLMARREAWKKQNRLKYTARYILANALAAKKVVKPIKCSGCGKPTSVLHGHHADYTKPLDVLWLCPPCHKKEHMRCP